MKKISIITLGMSAVLISACSQPPAPVAHKGNQFFGKNGTVALALANSTTKSDAYIPSYEPAVMAAPAPVEIIEVTELTLPEPVKPALYVERYEAPAQPQISAAEHPQLTPLPMDQLASAVVPANPLQAAIKAERKQSNMASIGDSTFIWPVDGKIVSSFGPKKNGLVNDGINIAAGEGEPIWAAAAGEVVYSGNELKGYGNMMIVRHNNGWMTAYAHASDMLVKKGGRVEQGDLIGYVGKTGAVNSAQLHFGIREGKKPVDPETLLPRRVASVR